jgi:DHA2 family multidrug resistance protein
MKQTEPLPPLKLLLLFICLSLSTFMMVLDYSIANISIPYIAGDLSTSVDEGTYVITSFAVGNAIGLAMTGWLTKRVGEVRLIVFSILLFALWSWICGASINLNMLVVSRFVQGLVGGPIVPLSQSLLIKNGTARTRSRDLAFWSMIIITAPVLGPISGGYISDWYHWPWIFYINIPVGLFAALIIYLILKKRDSEIEKIPGDIPGILLLAIGVGCLQIFLDKGQQWDWIRSPRICALIIGTIVAFTYLFIRELWEDRPLLNLRLFRIPSFFISIMCLIVSYAIYFGTIVLVPLWLQESMGYNAEWAGIAVSALGIGAVFLSPLVPKIIGRFGNLWTLIGSLAIFGLSCFYTAFFTTAVDVIHVSWSRFLFGCGFVFYINPLIAMSVQEVPPSELPNATGIFHFVRALVGGIGTSLFTTLLQRRTIYHHERIGSSLTFANPFTPQIKDPASLAELNQLLDQESALLAINDAFYLMAWCFAGLIVLLIGWRFWRRNRSIATIQPDVPFLGE